MNDPFTAAIDDMLSELLSVIDYDLCKETFGSDEPDLDYLEGLRFIVRQHIHSIILGRISSASQRVS